VHNCELLVLGTTSSYDFPTTVTAFDKSYNGGESTFNVISYDNGSDIFVARISQDGQPAIASTYLGGSNNDGLNPFYFQNKSPLVKNYGDQLRGNHFRPQGNLFISTVTVFDKGRFVLKIKWI